MELVEGVPCTLTVDFRVESNDLPLAAVSFGGGRSGRPMVHLAAAADAARAADVALVVVGTDYRWESRG